MNGTGELRVVVDLEVKDGEIGVGCTTADYGSYVDREVFVASGMRRKVYVPIGASGAASHVMLRNASPQGRSLARVNGLEIRRVTAAEEIEEHSELWAPLVPPFPMVPRSCEQYGPRLCRPISSRS